MQTSKRPCQRLQSWESEDQRRSSMPFGLNLHDRGRLCMRVAGCPTCQGCGSYGKQHSWATNMSEHHPAVSCSMAVHRCGCYVLTSLVAFISRRRNITSSGKVALTGTAAGVSYDCELPFRCRYTQNEQAEGSQPCSYIITLSTPPRQYRRELKLLNNAPNNNISNHYPA